MNFINDADEQWWNEERYWRQWLKETDPLILPNDPKYWTKLEQRIMTKVPHVKVEVESPKGESRQEKEEIADRR